MSATEPTPDDHLDSLFELDDKENPEESAGESDAAEASTEESTDEEPESEPAPSSDPVPAEEDPAPPPVVAAGESDEPGTSAVDVDDEKAVLEKRAQGLEKELKKLREQRREWERRRLALEAPAPTREAAPPVPPAPDVGKKLPVSVSEDGQDVYVDLAAADTYIEERAREIARSEMAPSPEQVADYEWRTRVNEFVQSDPENLTPLVQEALQAAEFIESSVTNAVEQYGFQGQGLKDVLGFMDYTGIREKVNEYFPDVADNLEHFLPAFSSNNTGYKIMALERMAESRSRPSGSESQSQRTLEDVSRAPTSMARKGGTRSEGPNVDEKEFNELEKEFRDDIFGMAEDRHKRYLELGKKLGKPGIAP